MAITDEELRELKLAHKCLRDEFDALRLDVRHLQSVCRTPLKRVRMTDTVRDVKAGGVECVDGRADDVEGKTVVADAFDEDLGTLASGIEAWGANLREHRTGETKPLRVGKPSISEGGRRPLSSERRKPSISQGQIAEVKRKLKAMSYTGVRGRDMNVFFSRLDKDRSGKLEEQEFFGLIRRCLKIPPRIIDDEEITELFALVDENGDGHITVGEVCAFIGERVPPSPVERDAFESKGLALSASDSEAALKTPTQQLHVVQSSKQGTASTSGEQGALALERDTAHQSLEREAVQDSLDTKPWAVEQEKVNSILAQDVTPPSSLPEEKASSSKVQSKVAKPSVQGKATRRSLQNMASNQRKEQRQSQKQQNPEAKDKVLTSHPGEVGRCRRAMRSVSKEQSSKVCAVAKAAMLHTGITGSGLRTAFEESTGHDGTVDMVDLRRVIRRTLKISPDQMSQHDIDCLYFVMDSKGEGAVSIQSVCTFLQALPTDSADEGDAVQDKDSLFLLAQPLLKASNTGHKSGAWQVSLAKVSSALKNHADPNVWSGPGTPLLAAVSAHCHEVIQLLLASRADPNVEGQNGVCALHIAAYNGWDMCVSLLLRSGADANVMDSLGQTPLFFAPTRATCLSLYDGHADLNAINVQGQSALHSAAKAGLQDVTEWMAGRAGRALVHHRDQQGKTAGDYARDTGIKASTLNLLFDRQATPESEVSHQESEKKKPGLPAERLLEIQSRINLASYRADPRYRQLRVLFSRYDKDGSGELDEEAFRNVIRWKLKIPQCHISDNEIAALFSSMEGDQRHVSIDHICSFLGENVGLSWEQLAEVRAKLRSFFDASGEDIRLLCEVEGQLDEDGFHDFLRGKLKMPPAHMSDYEISGLFEWASRGGKASIA
eukprot:TRINITY_DN12701_c0_g3_i1.p1 TRINITY_DN12701_c0_g3~~TRINITY_DN12701_c0_g3_i1.p1  ORF type:complete len:904 (-),score=184.96 TRINITY_DN12701_c0_g3_i1:29-2698(-)